MLILFLCFLASLEEIRKNKDKRKLHSNTYPSLLFETHPFIGFISGSLLSNGLPRLSHKNRTSVLALSPSKPRFKPVKATPLPFSILAIPKDFLASPEPLIWGLTERVIPDVPGTKLSWNNESDIQIYTRLVLKEIVDMLFINRFIDGSTKISSEVQFASAKPDLVMIVRNGFPIGVAECKIPSSSSFYDPNSELPAAMDDEHVFGQVYFYLIQLRCQFGVSNPFCLLSTYNYFKCFWLDDNQLVGVNRFLTIDQRSSEQLSSTNMSDASRSFLHSIKSVADAALQNPDTPAVMSSSTSSPTASSSKEPKLYCSEAVEFQDEKSVAFIASVIYKMSMCSINPPTMDTFSQHSLNIVYTKTSWLWENCAPFRNGIQLNHNRVPELDEPSERLVLIKYIDSGLHGHVWLVSDLCGRVGVVKFPKLSHNGTDSDSIVKSIESEVKIWKSIFMIDGVTMLTVCSTECLYTPLIDLFTAEDLNANRESVILDITNTIHLLASNGIEHMDVKLEHFGRYYKSPGVYVPVAIDFSVHKVHSPGYDANAISRRMLESFNGSLSRYPVISPPMTSESAHESGII